MSRQRSNRSVGSGQLPSRMPLRMISSKRLQTLEESSRQKWSHPQDVDQFRATANPLRQTRMLPKERLIDEAMVTRRGLSGGDSQGFGFTKVNAQIQNLDANWQTAKLNHVPQDFGAGIRWVTQTSVEPGAYIQGCVKTCSRWCRSSLWSRRPQGRSDRPQCNRSTSRNRKWMRYRAGNFAGLSMKSRPAAELDSVCSLLKMRRVIREGRSAHTW